jgi:hypothetical protein
MATECATGERSACLFGLVARSSPVLCAEGGVVVLAAGMSTDVRTPEAGIGFKEFR